MTIVLDGRRTTIPLAHDVSILDGAQRVRPDLPFACKGGVCGTCRARVVAGEVDLRRNFALDPAELAAGFVLTCQSYATTWRRHHRLRHVKSTRIRVFGRASASETSWPTRPAWSGNSVSSGLGGDGGGLGGDLLGVAEVLRRHDTEVVVELVAPRHAGGDVDLRDLVARHAFEVHQQRPQ